MNDRPRGPHSRKLLAELEEIAASIDFEKPARRLEHLGQSLIDAANRMRAGDPLIFKDMTEDDFKTLINLVTAHMIAADLAEAAHAADAEDN